MIPVTYYSVPIKDRNSDGDFMGSKKTLWQKIKLIAAKRKNAPRWTDIKKFGLKRARGRRINIVTKHWRRGRHKI